MSLLDTDALVKQVYVGLQQTRLLSFVVFSNECGDVHVGTIPLVFITVVETVVANATYLTCTLKLVLALGTAILVAHALVYGLFDYNLLFCQAL